MISMFGAIGHHDSLIRLHTPFCIIDLTNEGPGRIYAAGPFIHVHPSRHAKASTDRPVHPSHRLRMRRYPSLELHAAIDDQSLSGHVIGIMTSQE